jgi:hypothetical protein
VNVWFPHSWFATLVSSAVDVPSSYSAIGCTVDFIGRKYKNKVIPPPKIVIIKIAKI